MSDRDRQIGQNLMRLRGDMSQQELAERMKDSGWKWSQSTVWSVEQGTRPLRLAEAEAVAAILTLVDPSVLLERDSLSEVRSMMRTTTIAERELRNAITEYIRRLHQLAGVADAHVEALSPSLRDDIASWLDTTPRRVVDEVLDGYAMDDRAHQATIDRLIGSTGDEPTREHQSFADRLDKALE